MAGSPLDRAFSRDDLAAIDLAVREAEARSPGEIVGPPARRTEMVLRVEQPGIQANGLGELGDRISGAALLPEHESEPVVRLGERRRQPDRGRVGSCRRCQIVQPLVNEPEQVLRFAGFRVLRRSRFGGGSSPLEVSGVEIRARLAQQRGRTPCRGVVLLREGRRSKAQQH